ncbi:hypothetical protein [Nocardia asteroides]|uniref:hypothetical protein n=1 Tax=Nocardia asteroides TaxID=1824 RepID=UPI0033E09698
MATAGIVALAVAGCAIEPASPEQQADRERKAASVVVFKLHMNKDLWDRTKAAAGFRMTKSIDQPKNLTEEPNGTVTVELTGPQMVDYLQILDHNAHGGNNPQDASLATAVYDAIAPVVDTIESPLPATAPAPEITINAGTSGAAPAPAASTSTPVPTR